MRRTRILGFRHADTRLQVGADKYRTTRYLEDNEEAQRTVPVQASGEDNHAFD